MHVPLIVHAVALVVALVALVNAVIRARAPGTFPLVTLLRRWFSRTPTLELASLAVLAGVASVVAVPLCGTLGGWGRFTTTGPLSVHWIALAVAGAGVKTVFVLFEEIIFRGALVSQLGRWRGPRVAVAVSALVFAAAHGGRSPTDAAVLFADGIGFALAFVTTGSLWVAAIWHLSKNLSVWLFFGRGTVDVAQGPLAWHATGPGWAFGTEVSAGLLEVAATVLVVGLAGWVLVRRTPAGTLYRVF